MTVLQAAAQAVAQLSIFDLTDFENNGTVKKFEHAESVIAGSFNSFGVRFVFLMFSFSENIEFFSHNSYPSNGHRRQMTEGKRGKRIKLVWTN